MLRVALRPIRSVTRGVAFAAITLTLAACQQHGGASGSDQVTERDAESHEALLPASEYFEELTEQAFTASPAALDNLIEQAGQAAARDSRTLSASTDATLARRLTEIDAARASLNRADLAIAAVESYRLLVSAGPADARVPVEVSLMDYAGFRYGADLAAQPVRWADARSAADFASEQWRLIEARVSDVTLHKRVSTVVLGLKNAAEANDVGAARAADAEELDLVDELEVFFSKEAG